MRKLSVFLVLVAVLALTLATVSAQTVKCITPKQSAVNLRGHHEQNAQRVGTLAFGSQLQIVRKFNRWYAVPHDGGSAWVADWVVNEVACVGAAQSQPALQPAQTQQSQTQSPAEVDNYCFVNRHCTTDAQWQQGWADYQRDLQAGTVNTSTSAPAAAQTNAFAFSGNTDQTVGPVFLSAGLWKISVSGGRWLGINAEAFPIDANCLWRYISGSRILIVSWSTRPSSDSFRVYEDCNVMINVSSSVGRSWNMNLDKVG
ncbi:MAG: hypothetical protein OXG60_00800 [Chloroflexi bacterium]|nr:hypothetical protein [Chloroflexota bacterium]